MTRVKSAFANPADPYSDDLFEDPSNDPGEDPSNDPGEDPSNNPDKDPSNDPREDPYLVWSNLTLLCVWTDDEYLKFVTIL